MIPTLTLEPLAPPTSRPDSRPQPSSLPPFASSAIPRANFRFSLCPRRAIALVFTLLLLLLGALSTSPAAVTVKVVEQSGNVVATASGSVDTSGLTPAGVSNGNGWVWPGFSVGSLIQLGGAESADFNLFSGISGPVTFGTTARGTNVSSGSGMTVGMIANSRLLLPTDYVSKSEIVATSTWIDKTFASLGLTPGNYTWTWGSGANADSFILQIGEPPALAATHWLGQTNSTWTGSNWASDATGTATPAIPTSTSDITFSATGAQNLNTTLGQDFTIQNLTVNSSAGIGGSNALTITGATNVSNGTLTLNNGVTVNSQTNSLVEATGTGSTSIVTGANSKWNTTGALSVGFNPAQTGTLNVLNGGSVTSASLSAGANSDATGNVTVSGAGSMLTSSTTFIGSSGNGTLNIESGGVQQTNGYASIGEYEGSVGVATVTGAGSKWKISSSLTIDSGGDGTLNILNGGIVSNAEAYLATSSSLKATVTVSDSGSKWENSGSVFIGQVGPATLDIQNGGLVSTGYTAIGLTNTGIGKVTVTGSGSKWTGSNLILVGAGGSGTLDIKAGGVVTAVGGFVGANAGSVGSVTVDGSGSTWDAGAIFQIGKLGTGELTLSNGAQVTTTAAVVVAEGAGSKGTLNIGAFVDGTIVTAATTGGSVTATEISGGLGDATLNFNQSNDITIAPKITGSAKVNQLGSGTTTLTGNSTYQGLTTVSAGALYVNGNTSTAYGYITVNGGTLGGSGIIGGPVNVQSGGTITAGSNATSTGLLVVGGFNLYSGSTALFQLAGTSSFDQISSPGIFAAGSQTLNLQLTGDYTGNAGDTFKIFQANTYNIDAATFNVTSNLGSQFKWDLSDLKSKGEVKIALNFLPATHWLGQTNATWSGTNWASDSAGTATLALPTSTSDITFSATGAQNLTTTLGQDFTIQNLTVNSSAGIGGSNALSITGASNVGNGTLNVANGTLTLNNGVTVNSIFLSAGANSGATGTVTVSGAGSMLSTNSTSIGGSGNGTLNIESGGVQQTIGDARIGNNVGSVGVVTVTGAGSKWTVPLFSSNFLIAGGGDGTLNVLNGGVVSSGSALLASSSSAKATVIVNGSGSKWETTISGFIFVGVGGSATVDIQNGGLVSSGVVTIAQSSKVTVTGSGSKWTSNSFFGVGQVGLGTLDIKAGGLVTCLSGDVGINAGSVGSVTVDGSGSTWEAGTVGIQVGSRDGSKGTLQITNGGQVTTTAAVVLAKESGSNGTLNIGAFVDGTIVTAPTTGGSVTATEISGGLGNATLNFNQSNDITIAPKITGSAKVNQLGSGTTTLTGNSTYQVLTTVSAGALYINGNNSTAYGNITVTGGTLGGSGIIGGPVYVKSGGTITAGSNATSTGLLAVGGFTLDSGSTALFQLAGTSSFDQIRSPGIIAYAGNHTLNLQLTGDYTGAAGDTFKIFDANSYVLDAATFNVTSNLGSQFKWDLSDLKSKGEVKIALVIPPPTVTGISPNNGGTLGGTTVTITGTDFTGVTAVTIGGTAATNVNVVNATTLTCTTPAGVAGTASVVVTTPSGSNAANTLFTYEVLADLAVTLTSSPNPVLASGNLTFTIALTNNGPSAALNPTVSLPLPERLTFVSANAPVGWQISNPSVGAGGTVTISHSTLANGATATFTVIAMVKAATPNGTQWSAVATCGSSSRDLVSTNNTSSSPTAVGTVNPTSLQLTATGVINRQNGMFDFTVNVTNTTPLPINGFRLRIDFSSYLAAHPSLRLYNAASAPGSSDVFVDYPYPVPVDGVIPVKLSFYTVNRAFPNPFAPILTAEALPTSAVSHTDGSGVQPRMVLLSDSNVLLEFPSTPGRWYRIRFSSDLVNWFECPVPIEASNNRMQWIDSGAPFTNVPPASVPSRFYRVNEIATPRS